MLLSPSPGSPRSISGTSKKGTHRGEEERRGRERQRGQTNKKRRGINIYSFLYQTQFVSNAQKLEQMKTLMPGRR